MSRNIIVSNRLPVKIRETDGLLEYKSSEGGLATGLGSIYQDGDNLWIGWPGKVVPNHQKQKVTADLYRQNLHPVYLTEEEINSYYEGFSNETLWPLFHYFPSFSSFNHNHWESYKKVNEKFTEEILKVAGPEDTVWVHDYQLMLVPEMLRKAMPKLTIGFFQHIPFPSYEVFRSIPWRKELLCGLTGADVIGFHTYDDARHYMSCVEQLTDFEVAANELKVDKRKVLVDAFPISIDYKKFFDQANEARTCSVQRKIKQLVNNNQLLMSVDRLDYSKGILHRLRAYKLLLERHPELHGKVRLVQLIVPSRDKVKKYKELKEEMNKLVGEINGQYGTFGWQPIHHFYRSFPPTLLSALYKASDVALVTPIRDGMNLVCKEFVASKTDKKGVLILSEMAGASRELSEAITVNPNDIISFSEKIYEALNMPEAEQRQRMTAMQQTVSKFDIKQWVNNFYRKLRDVKAKQGEQNTKPMTATTRANIFTSYNHTSQRLILLDYDGTLVPFKVNPDDAAPDPELLKLLELLTSDDYNNVVITSGRDYHTLDKWLGHLPIDIIAEHGAWYKLKDTPWIKNVELSSTDWYEGVKEIMNVFNARTPGAFIEEKSFSLVWHYRAAAEDIGELHAKAFMNDVKHYISGKGLQLLQANKAVEVKSVSINKGLSIQKWLHNNNYDFIMAVGDDHTDEDMFKALPNEAFSIKVGSTNSAAAYYVETWREARTILSNLIHNNGQKETQVIKLIKAAS